MTQAFTFTVIDLTHWLDLIEQALRFRALKISDPARLKAAGNRAAKATLPPRYQNVRGSCFHRLQRIARTTARYETVERQALIEDARACLEHLIERATAVSDLHDELIDLSDRDYQRFRIELTNHMFPADRGRQRRFRADIDA